MIMTEGENKTRQTLIFHTPLDTFVGLVLVRDVAAEFRQLGIRGAMDFYYHSQGDQGVLRVEAVNPQDIDIFNIALSKGGVHFTWVSLGIPGISGIPGTDPGSST